MARILPALFGVVLALLASSAMGLRVNVTIETNMHVKSLFIGYQNKFGVMFKNTQERKKAMETFSESVSFVETQNAQGNKHFKLGINKFSHITWEEFSDKYLMKDGNKFLDASKIEADMASNPKITYYTARGMTPVFITQFSNPGRRLQTISPFNTKLTPVLSVPSWVNWRRYATPIKDQGKCSSCYAFAGVGTYEVLISLKYNRFFSLSEQEIMDCSPYANGCIGGNPADVFLYASQNGLAESSQYPYIQKVGICRKFSADEKVFSSLKYRYLNPDIYTILTAISEGPVVLIHTTNRNFKNYQSGVFDDPTCTADLNHSAVAIGYDLTAPVPYIYLKNGWGTDWGENGFYKLAIGPIMNGSKGTCKMLSHNYNSQPYF